MSVFDKIKDRLTAKYSEWIKVEDDKSGWTIFPNGKLKSNTLIGGLV